MKNKNLSSWKFFIAYRNALSKHNNKINNAYFWLDFVFFSDKTDTLEVTDFQVHEGQVLQ